MKKRKGFGRFLLIIGVLITGGAIFVLKKLKNISKSYDKLTLFNNEEIKFDTEDDIKDTAIAFSDASIDFTDLDITEASIKLLILFSNVKIKVPEGWKVILNGDKKSSNLDESISEDSIPEDNPIILNIDYDISYSNVKITN
ncbi:hypothetical protein SH1V18_36100 [Vallitalea longa]|uniref:Cell wall-active antibiotics response LiaF-like C-terminal domain-containing protein n=1 Tax=Vallitalea longa TaxID=2936439 RepID=A0A9W5YEP0_9FIRM|nr:hypothetical protein [Vallitalea longa]GKX31130.1 hypothetical protein SH1V18_36100 [Vallitalea longa]